MRPDSAEFNELLQQFKGKKRAMLRAVASGIGITKSERALKMAPDLTYSWCRSDPAFKAALAEAREASIDGLEALLMQCARIAPTDPRYQQSLQFMLKARRRDMYGDHVVQETRTLQPLEIVLTEPESDPSCE